MRIPALIPFTLLALAVPPAARAQDLGSLPRDLAQRITEVLNDPATVRHEGETAVEAGRTVGASLAVLDGDLALAGRVEGDVVVLNGNLALAAGAEITGGVIVAGGEIEGLDDAVVAGEMVIFAEPVPHCLRGRQVDLGCGAVRRAAVADGPELGVPDAARGFASGGGEEREKGRVTLVVRADRSYNRVEGLPVRFGPALETGGSNPTRLQAMAVFRTEEGSGEFGVERWGYDARIEQYLGGHRAFRVGARAFSLVEPIEAWHLTDLENSLSTLLLHQDYRDHYQREGWSAYAVVTPPRSPVTLRGELLWERHRSVAPASPWAVFDNDEPWRMQPLVAEGPLRALLASAVVDTRNEAWDPSSGWYVRAEVEHTLASDLVRPALVVAGGYGQPVVPSNRFGEYTRGVVDLRRYNRISPSSRLNLRIAGGGSMSVFPLPPQRQHAFGGEGTLPGYGLLTLDCGVRYFGGPRADARTGTRFFGGYGCDRFVLFQAEYRGDVDLGQGSGGGAGWMEAAGLGTDLGWVLFVDAGAGWTSLAAHHDEHTAVDAGAGILLGDLGVYVAVPVADRYGRGGLNFFVRLAPRF
ncbi:MAG TPA: hypothetical protein VFR37_16885 [Longimicrobium sp.]|nr:hypothetical protein [Longimicrobium sp.]